MLFCRHNGIRLAASSPYHPRTNGLAERAVQTVKMAVAKMKDGVTPLPDVLSRMLFEYLSTAQTTTQRSPAELVFGQQLRTRWDLLRPETASTVFRHQEKMIRGTVHEDYAVGEAVFVRQFPLKKR
jgi:hypothetical protein